MPASSTGFWVASTRNGRGRSRVTPSADTRRSAMASRRADCVFGVARLISSDRRTLVKIGPGPELEGALLLVEDRRPGDVAGEHVGRALHPVGGGVDRLGDGPGQHRLAGAGHVLEEDVALAEDGHQGEPHDVGLALDDRLDVLDDRLEGGREGHGVDASRMRCAAPGPFRSRRATPVVDPTLHRHGNGVLCQNGPRTVTRRHRSADAGPSSCRTATQFNSPSPDNCRDRHSNRARKRRRPGSSWVERRRDNPRSAAGPVGWAAMEPVIWDDRPS